MPETEKNTLEKEAEVSKEKKLNIQETAIVQSSAAPAAASEKTSQESGEEKGEEITNVQAMGLTKREDKIIFENVPRDKVEGEKGIKKRLEDLGAKRREYLAANRSPLFQTLPERDFAQEQKASYQYFLDQKLPKLFSFYFPFEFSDYNNDVWINASEIKYQESNSEEEARANSSTWKLGEEGDKLIAKFHCEQDQRVDFCTLPKITRQGSFVINGHDKVVVFHIYRGAKNPRSIELKFLNSKTVIGLLDIFRTFDVSPELLEKIFDNEELNIEDYQEAKPLKLGISHPLFRFLFIKKNSYFDLGKLGRKKYNQKTNIFRQIEDQTLASDLYDSNQKLILKKNTVLTGKNLQILKKSLEEKKIPAIILPHSTNELYLIKIKSPQNPVKILYVVGIAEDLPEEKTYFDLADLICAVSSYVNLHYGLGRVEKEEEKDNLENQIVRRVGDLIYSLFESKLGGFLQNLGNAYVTNYLSQLKKVDLARIPDLDLRSTNNIFENLQKIFFNSSPLVQLQNQNNPLSEISYSRKLSVLGLGGFGTNTTLNARNINSSYYGRYDLVETPEGQKIGLIHNLTIGAEINNYGQVVHSCYFVQNGVVTSRLDYLTKAEVLVRHQGDFKQVPKEKHNDATRMLMSSNMQRQSVTLLKNEAPLVASGLESTLLNNSLLVIKAEEKGKVEYVDSHQIIIKESNKKEKTYRLNQSVVSNKNILNYSCPLVKKGEKVEKGQMIACGNYADQGELALEDILTSLLVKKHKVIRCNTKYGPELFTPSPHSSTPLPHLDENGLVKVGSKVKGGDVLVGKQTPEPSLGKETEEEMLLLNILGKKTQRFVNSSLILPAEDEGIVYEVKTKKFTDDGDELELVEVYVFCERKLEVGDKLTTRFGNKGVVAKIVPESDMPFDEEGKTIDIIFNPLGVPTRLNLGQLLEAILGWAARKLNTQFLFRAFNTPSTEVIKEIVKEAGIKNYGSSKLFDGRTGLPFHLPVYNGYIYVVKVNHMVADKFHARNTGPRSLIYQQPLKAAWNLMEMMGPKSDDIYKCILMQKNLIFGDRQTDLQSNQSESFNLLLQYLRGIGFDLQATDYQGREIDFYDWLSPQRIKQLSFANEKFKITNSKTINARTFKPELGGLFDPRIFGPFLNYECYCGKYKVTNIILFKNLAANLSKILEISAKDLEDIIYLRSYVVIDNGLTKLLKKKKILEKKLDLDLIKEILQEVIQDGSSTEEVIEQAQELSDSLVERENPNDKLLRGVDVEEELQKIKTSSKGILQKVEIEKKRFLQALQKNGIKLEWMIISDLPIIPCGLRPVTKLKEKNTVAASQTDSLLKKIILTDERLSSYLESNKELGVFPVDIIHNAKRKLQEAVDRYIYGSSYAKDEIKSLSQNLSGKEGILRRYSLGKRVDYSARSVIVPNPSLLLDQIGLPEAEKMLLDKDPIIFPLLNEIVQNHPVLANRAPSLHRLSIQGFYPKLTNGNSIELNPLITTPLNADFDGDQIAIHLPLTKKCCEEIKERVLSSHHLIDPKNVGRNFAAAKNEFIFTTLGKLRFNQILPPSFPFYLNDLGWWHNEEKEQVVRVTPQEEMVHFLDQLKKVSFDYATCSGISISPFELGEIGSKKELIQQSKRKECKDELQKQLISDLEGKTNTSFYHIWASGARASSENLTQLFAMLYGAIKGMTDIALKTAAAGDLTRRLVESTQNLVIISDDCQTDSGILLEENSELSLFERMYGRYLVRDILDKKETILFLEGICQKCYGLDLSRPGKTIAIGEAVGIIAAQSLGEPGTQLTMRTFHVGGIAGEGEDITQGLPKVKQIFDNIKPKKGEKAVLAKTTGKITSIEENLIKQKNLKEGEFIYPKDKGKIVKVNEGDEVKKGEKITTGKVDLGEYLEIMGRDICQDYIKEEVRRVYSSQGIDINEKHIEIFARQMLSRVEVIDSGDSDYLVGDIVNYQHLRKINQSLVTNNKKPASFKNIISSLKDLASQPDSFLAGISFQNTLKSLINYSLYQPVDYLKGSKESLIAGQLVPVGNGLAEREKYLHSKKVRIRRSKIE
nr:15453_t:CDS:10 [Entrophospora candida]